MTTSQHDPLAHSIVHFSSNLAASAPHASTLRQPHSRGEVDFVES
jgi:hypothetical protein